MPAAVSKRYAKALLAVAQEEGREQAVEGELIEASTVLGAPDMLEVVGLVRLDARARRALVEEVARRLSLSVLMRDFLLLLAQKGRLGFLSAISDHYQRLLDRKARRSRARVISASALTEPQLQALVSAFERLTATTVVARTEMDPGLIGGVVVEIGGQVYDGSLRTQVARMGEALGARL